MPETISVLKARFGGYENIPNQELYDALTLPQTQKDLINLARPHNSEGRDTEFRISEFRSHPFVDSVRKRIVMEPSFCARMTPEHRADLIALFFPEYAGEGTGNSNLSQ